MGEEINKIESEKTAQIDRSKETTQKTNQKGEEYTDTNDQERCGLCPYNFVGWLPVFLLEVDIDRRTSGQ